MKIVYISDMGDEDFSDYPKDALFVLDDSRDNRKFDPETGCFYYEDSEPAEKKELELQILKNLAADPERQAVSSKTK